MTHLKVSRTQVSDLRPLAPLRKLEVLSASWTTIADVSSLALMGNSTWLDLRYTQVSDLRPLARLERLKHLYLDSTGASDLSPLAGLIDLETLWLSFTRVRSVAPLIRLTKLKELRLDYTAIHHIAPLVDHKQLSLLWLTGTEVGDLSPLLDDSNLGELHLVGNGWVSAVEQVKQIEQALPVCKVIFFDHALTRMQRPVASGSRSPAPCRSRRAIRCGNERTSGRGSWHAIPAVRFFPRGC